MLYFPNARRALDALVASAKESTAANLELVNSNSSAKSLDNFVGAKMIVIQRDFNEIDLQRSLTQIASTLGRTAVVRVLGESTYLVENQAGFNKEILSRLIADLGPDTRLYADDLMTSQTPR